MIVQLSAPLRIAAALGFAALASAAVTVAQSRPSDSAVADMLARGWAALAKLELAEASKIANQALLAEPHSASAVALAVEVEIARSRGAGGLRTYEQWLGSRTIEEAYVLRRVARALLWDAAAQAPGSGLATEALAALAADGDAAASAQLAQRAASGGLAELAASASTGNEASVDLLIKRVQEIPASKVNLIKALGQSGSRRAVPVVVEFLSDRRDEHRAAAAEALGRLGSGVDRLRPLLKDPNFTVRLKAAGALYRLEDPAGLALLQQIAASEHAGVRVAAAEEMASRPDAAWQTLVRGLTEDGDPLVRLQAARLLAPHDAETATAVLEGLARDENPAIREEAGRVRVGLVTRDITELRRLLRLSGAEQIAAAARILELTRRGAAP